MRARNADWHQTYTMPQLWNYFQSRTNHGSYFYDWTTENEVAWKNFYQRYMRLINDYKNMGGRVTAGTDSGFICKTYGFAYIEELELMREAGFLPLEVIRRRRCTARRRCTSRRANAAESASCAPACWPTW